MEIEKNSSTYNQIEKAIKYIDENFKSHPSIDEIALMKKNKEDSEKL